MKLLLIILAAVFGIILCILHFPINLEYVFSLDNDLNMHSRINLGIFGGRVKIKIPDFKGKKKNSLGGSKDNGDKSKKFLDKARELNNILDKVLKTYNGSRNHIKKKIIVNNIDFYIKFGLFDAAQTGIAIGYIWGALYGLYAFICENATVKRHNFQVEPYYENYWLEIKTSGIIKLTLVNIISVALRIYFNYKKINKNKEA